MEHKLISKQQSIPLLQKAVELGASAAAIIMSRDILVKNSLASLCNGDFVCPNYGRAPSCPPHVKGPDQFRKWQSQSEYAITVKIELPASVMFSDERKSVMRQLHQIVAAVEQKAIEAGYKGSKAFAGGSCKDLFCSDQDTCCVLEGNKPCRHLDSARPSMSGFGIDVSQLMRSSGWSGQKTEKSDANDNDNISWVAGLVLLI